MQLLHITFHRVVVCWKRVNPAIAFELISAQQQPIYYKGFTILHGRLCICICILNVIQLLLYCHQAAQKGHVINQQWWENVCRTSQRQFECHIVNLCSAVHILCLIDCVSYLLCIKKRLQSYKGLKNHAANINNVPSRFGDKSK